MKLKEAFEFARACELCTVGEAMYNIFLHAANLFDYGTMNSELNELNNDFKELHKRTRINEDSLIEDAAKYCE